MCSLHMYRRVSLNPLKDGGFPRGLKLACGQNWDCTCFDLERGRRRGISTVLIELSMNALRPSLYSHVPP